MGGGKGAVEPVPHSQTNQLLLDQGGLPIVISYFWVSYFWFFWDFWAVARKLK
jgi:hypothetical protein